MLNTLRNYSPVVIMAALVKIDEHWQSVKSLPDTSSVLDRVIRLSMGDRGVGRSRLIQDQYQANDAVITISNGLHADMVKSLRTKGFANPPVSTLANADYRFRGLTFDRIWVDDAQYIELDTVFLHLNHHRFKQIILLG